MTATQQKAAPRRGTGQAASNQQRPHLSSPWPDCNPTQVRSERDVAKVLAILDEIKMDAIKTEGRGR
jgi:hypothetical protein